MKFQLDPTKNENFPIYPHCKNRSLWQRHVYRHDVAKVGDFYRHVVAKVSDFNDEVYVEILCLLSDPAEISFLTT